MARHGASFYVADCSSSYRGVPFRDTERVTVSRNICKASWLRKSADNHLLSRIPASTPEKAKYKAFAKYKTFVYVRARACVYCVRDRVA